MNQANDLKSGNRRKRSKGAAGPGRVSEPAGWVNWVEPDPNSPAGKAAASNYKAGMVSSGRILDVATRLFAYHGFEGTSIREITAQAEVNVGAVTYHFGTKEELYFTVLNSFMGAFAREAETIARGDAPPLDRLEKIVRHFFHHVGSHPAMVPLMVREMAGDRPLAPPVARFLQRVMPLIVQVVTEGQQDGTIRPGDPLLLTLSTLAQPVYLNLARKGISVATGLDTADPALSDRLVDHCVTLVRAALENRP